VVVAGLAQGQAAAGWDVRVACPDTEPLVGWLHDAGITHLPWEAARQPGPATAREIRDLRGIVRASRPDVVHLHSSKAGLVGRLVVRGSTATVFQPHGWSFAAVTGRAARAAVAWERAAARWTDVLLCVSEAEQRAGQRAGVRARWCVVPNGVDLTRFVPGDSTAQAAARGRLGLGPGPLAVCIGRLCHQKAQDLLLDAWPAVRDAVADARLLLVGGGSLERAGRLPPGVVAVGEQPDVTDWLHAADVVAAPSRWEGMSLGVLEAMASARSVVAADVEGMREAIGDGEAGALVPPEDAAALAEAIVPRLRDPGGADAEGRAGRRRVVSRFDVRRSIEDVARITLEVVEVRRQRARG
jgi:glycosyltransferase involved in cell wall biosynthesis